MLTSCHVVGHKVGSPNRSRPVAVASARRQIINRPPVLLQKEMIILQKETTEHREPGTSAPQGDEPGSPPSVLTPQSPCTIERAVGVGTLYQDTIYASAATTKGGTARCRRAGGVITPRRVGSASWVRGTSTLPSRGWGTVAITKV